MRTSASRIARNSVFIIGARVSDVLVGIITIAMATRYLGVEAFGQFAFLSAVSLVLVPVLSWGSTRILIREIAVEKEKAGPFLVDGLMLNVLMTAGMCMVLIAVAAAFRLTSRETILCLYLAMFAQTVLQMTQTVTAVFIAHERMFYSSAMEILVRLLSLAFLAGVVIFNRGLTGIFVALLAANLVGFGAAYMVLVRTFVVPRWRLNFPYMGYLFREGLPIAMASFLSQAYTYVGVFFLKQFQDFSQVSLFQAPQRVIMPLQVVPNSILLAFVPALSRFGNRQASHGNLEYVCQKAMKYILIFSLPVCIFGTVYAGEIVQLLFGKDFLDARVPFQFLIWTTIPLFSNILFSFVLTSLKEQRVLTVSNGVCFVFNCLLGVLFIPRYGAFGAAVSALLSYLVLFAVSYYYVSRTIVPVRLDGEGLKPLLAGGVTWCFLVFVAGRLGLLAGGAAALAVYCGVLLALRSFPRDEVEVFRSLLVRRGGRAKIVPDRDEHS